MRTFSIQVVLSTEVTYSYSYFNTSYIQTGQQPRFPLSTTQNTLKLNVLSIIWFFPYITIFPSYALNHIHFYLLPYYQYYYNIIFLFLLVFDAVIDFFYIFTFFRDFF